MLNQPLSFHSTINVYITYFHNTLYVSQFTTTYIVHKRVRIVSFLENLFYYFASFYLFIFCLDLNSTAKKKKLRLWLMIHLIESRPVSVIFHKIICINDVNVFDCGNFLYISGKYNMFSSKLSTLSNFNKNKLFCTSQFCFWIQPLYNELTMEREFVN